MHPVTRLGRVIQQLRSFADLHAAELDALAADLEASGSAEGAGKVRVHRDIQHDEGRLVVDELQDIQTELADIHSELAPSAAPPANPARETTAPERNAFGTSAPETTRATSAPETNAFGKSAPETNAPETNASETNAPETSAPETNAPETNAAAAAAPPDQPWLSSPKRAKWLAEEAQRDQQARQPRTRRDLFSRFSQ
jgi:hypothetical protein